MKKTEKTQKNQKPKRGGVPVYRQLRTKLIASFMIPVLCIIVLGVVSYRQASKAIISSYESARALCAENGIEL